MRGLYAITDCDNLSTQQLLTVTEEILRAGVAVLQYRDKSGNLEKRDLEARELRQLCREHGCLFIINDDVQLARSAGSDGVHLGRDDGNCITAREELGAGAIIGVSCYNSLAAAQAASAGGADYVAFGSFYPTTSKQNTAVAEPDIIMRAKEKIPLPVVAIGGITPDNCRVLLDNGADMIAVIGSVYRAGNPCSVVEEFNRVMAGSDNTRRSRANGNVRRSRVSGNVRRSRARGNPV